MWRGRHISGTSVPPHPRCQRRRQPRVDSIDMIWKYIVLVIRPAGFCVIAQPALGTSLPVTMIPSFLHTKPRREMVYGHSITAMNSYRQHPPWYLPARSPAHCTSPPPHVFLSSADSMDLPIYRFCFFIVHGIQIYVPPYTAHDPHRLRSPTRN